MEYNKNELGKFLDPGAIVKQLEIKRGSIVADFGCGPGYFSIPFAKIIGEDGKVYALDVLPQALEAVAAKAKNYGINNIITSRVNLEKENGSKMEANSLDWVILKDMLFQNQKKDIIIKEAYRVLKNNGQIMVVEWNQNDSTVGPESELRIAENDLKKMFSDHGFLIGKNINAGDFHYAFVAIKK
ncbi:MAG TPA: class I SAM-dependent methyltransferase [Candidatus Moranbacteria bacterium]|nr:class I SAM-dependent methyltransferase [Candidatus Moranbacteria bacterium]HRZ33534.1 class I SAM-dependent methyltransferase [Candidatus Moranbacteria bacterium]